MSGSAGEYHCATASNVNRRAQRRFLERSGKLSRPRPCGRPIAFLARGTSSWSLRLRIAAPPGHYLVRADAVDRLHHHQLHSAASVVGIRAP